MTSPNTPEPQPELCPVCRRLPILKAPTGEGCLRFGQVKRDLYATAWAEAECYRNGLDLRETELAALQAQYDALAADLPQLEACANLILRLHQQGPTESSRKRIKLLADWVAVRAGSGRKGPTP